MRATNASGGTGLEEVRLAEILLDRGGQAELEEARNLIDRADSAPILSGQFRHCLAGVRIALALDEKPRAAAWARRALALAFAPIRGWPITPSWVSWTPTRQPRPGSR